MTKNKYKLAVLIGRFQPFHAGHRAMVDSALNVAQSLLILIGSANAARSPKNPWTYSEREAMVNTILKDVPFGQFVSVHPLNDYRYDEARWILEVQNQVKYMGIADSDVVLMGHQKDRSSYYLDIFKQSWDYLDCGYFPLGSNRTIDGTKIRELYFENELPYLGGVVSQPVLDIIRKSEHDLKNVEMHKEYQFIKKYKDAWSHSPYPPVFITTDAVVMQSGHILLVRRKTEPGKGLWALPGGFVGQDEQIFNSCVRELREETGLKVPEIILRKAKAEYQYFDDPDRSLRGRTITHAFFFRLDDSQDLPRVRGGDDAEKAMWFSLAEIESMATSMFEDHWHIIEYFKNRTPK